MFSHQFLTSTMKYVLVPISTLGCGKSTTFRTLASLFPEWAHVENDNCSSKRQFYAKISQALEASPIVLLDRNNHLKSQRKEIMDMFQKPGINLVALDFVSKAPKLKLWSLTNARVQKRGDNHQSIRSESNAGMAKGIMADFIRKFEPFDRRNQPDEAFDYSIEMDLSPDSSLANAKLILGFLSKIEGLVAPSDSEVKAAFERALEFKVDVKPLPERKPRGARNGDSGKASQRKVEESASQPGKKKAQRTLDECFIPRGSANLGKKDSK